MNKEEEKQLVKIIRNVGDRNIKGEICCLSEELSKWIDENYVSKAEVKEKIEKRKKYMLNQPLRWSIKDDIDFLEDVLKELNI